jgi:hypothetical protein
VIWKPLATGIGDSFGRNLISITMAEENQGVVNYAGGSPATCGNFQSGSFNLTELDALSSQLDLARRNSTQTL